MIWSYFPTPVINLFTFPVQLVEAFHATLEEVAEADMLVVGGVSLFSFQSVLGSHRLNVPAEMFYLHAINKCYLAMCICTVNSALVIL